LQPLVVNELDTNSTETETMQRKIDAKPPKFTNLDNALMKA